MSDAILVVNADSSSLKYSVFLEQGETFDLLLGGQIESLYTAPRFKAKDVAGVAARLRVELDPAANATGGPLHQHGGQPDSSLVIPTNEELMIARHTRTLVVAGVSR